ncbi:MAG: hypothetical protein AAGA56_27330 [Myxococcota bacterium]
MGAVLFFPGAIAACSSGTNDPTDSGRAVSCPGLTRCDGACVDANHDPDNCGACGASCDEGQACVEGVCTAAACPEGTTSCAERCVDLRYDPRHCGACEAACGSDSICDDGNCTDMTACPTGQTPCGGICVDLDRNNDHCGGCDVACEDGQICNGEGQCQLSCQQRLLNCEDTCIDPFSDERYCGATDDCAGENAGEACAAGFACQGGTCAPSCPVGQIACNGQCIDPATDETYCGATFGCTGSSAGVTCAPGQICSGSTCITSCPAGLVECNSTCIDPDNDPNFCGANSLCGSFDVCGGGEYCNQGNCESLGVSCAPPTGTTVMPNQTTTFTSWARGYYFTAQSSFFITSARIPDLTGPQSIQIVRFTGGVPPVFPSDTSAYETLIFLPSSSITGAIAMCLPVTVGDVIGILGQRTVSSTPTTSYGPGASSVIIDGRTTTLNRLIYQGDITANIAGPLSTSTSSIGRIELETAPRN